MTTNSNNNASREGLLKELAWQSPIHPATALTLLLDLASSLVDAVLVGPEKAPEAHRRLVRLAQTCLDAANEMERALEDGTHFEWQSDVRRWTGLHDALDRAEDRADKATARAQTYRDALDRSGRSAQS